MPEAFYDVDFPSLKALGFLRTSEPDAAYRCLSFAIDDLARNWWPGDYHPWSTDYWPVAAQDTILDTFAIGLATIGFVPCLDDSVEPGFRKIALYAKGLEITHAAKQVGAAAWQSKLGPDEDIQHTLAGLEGPLYGKVVAFFKKPSNSG